MINTVHNNHSVEVYLPRGAGRRRQDVPNWLDHKKFNILSGLTIPGFAGGAATG